MLFSVGALSSTVLNVRSPSVSSTLVTSMVTRPVSSAPVIISSVNRAPPASVVAVTAASAKEFVSETEQAIADMTAEHASLPMQVDGACDSDDSDVGLQVDGTSDPGDGEQQEEQPQQQEEDIGDQGEAVAMTTGESEAGAEEAEVVNQEASLDAAPLQQEDGDTEMAPEAAVTAMATDPTAFLQAQDDAPQVTLAHMDAAAAMATDAVTTAESALTTEAAAVLALALGEVEPKEEPSEVAAPGTEVAAPASDMEAANADDGIKMEDDSEKLAGIVPMMDVSGTANAGTNDSG